MSIQDIIDARNAEWKQKKLDDWDASIPQALRGYNLEELISTRWSGKLTVVQTNNFKKYLKDPKKFLILCGPSGMGKTVMGIEVARKLLGDSVGATALYVGAPKVLSELSFGDAQGRDIISKYVSPDILFLDDVGAGSISMSDTRKNGMWAIIDQRWSMGKYTIISTNLSPVKDDKAGNEGFSLMEYLGESSWDRIISSYTLVTFSGKSLRKQNSQRETTRRRSKKN